MEQKLLTLPEHLGSPPVLSGVRVTRSLVLCVCFVDRCLFFVSFCPLCLLSFNVRMLIMVFSNSSYIFMKASDIALSVLLRYMDSDYPVGIFKLFLHAIVSFFYRKCLHTMKDGEDYHNNVFVMFNGKYTC